MLKTLAKLAASLILRDEIRLDAEATESLSHTLSSVLKDRDRLRIQVDSLERRYQTYRELATNDVNKLQQQHALLCQQVRQDLEACDVKLFSSENGFIRSRPLVYLAKCVRSVFAEQRLQLQAVRAELAEACKVADPAVTIDSRDLTQLAQYVRQLVAEQAAELQRCNERIEELSAPKV